MSIIFRIALVVAAVWFTFRVVWFVRKRVLRRRERRSIGFRCPACGSRDVDDFSDEDSGMCFACKHVWGVSVPNSDSDG